MRDGGPGICLAVDVRWLSGCREGGHAEFRSRIVTLAAEFRSRIVTLAAEFGSRIVTLAAEFGSRIVTLAAEFGSQLRHRLPGSYWFAVPSPMLNRDPRSCSPNPSSGMTRPLPKPS